LRSFQWCNQKSAIGSGFGVKPENSLFLNLPKMGLFALNFPKKTVVSNFLVPVVICNPCKAFKPINASKNPKHKPEADFLNTAETCQKSPQENQKIHFPQKFQM